MANEHLLIVSGFWPTQANPVSGVFVAQQAAAFTRMGLRVTIVFPGTAWKPASPVIPPSELGMDGVSLLRPDAWRVPQSLSGSAAAIGLNVAWFGYALSRCLGDLSRASPFDACIVHDTSFAGLSLPAWREHVRGRCVMVMHGVDPHLVSPDGVRRAARWFGAASQRLSAFVLVGSRLRALALELGIPADKLRIVGNGTDLPPVGSLTLIQRRPPGPRRVVSVSNLVPLKGIDDNLRALARVRATRPGLAWEYRVVGDGPARQELVALARDLRISDRVTFVGRVPYPEAMEEVAGADVFALPSWNEAFGIVYLEAMARAKPVIGCLGNGPADFVTSGKDGLLVRPRSVPELASAMTALLESPETCERMGGEGRRTAEAHTWDANARHVTELLGLGRGAVL